MQIRTVLITGGAGFVGSNLALRLKQSSETLRVIAFDNLLRSGSQLNLERLRRGGVEFAHGDIRCPEDLARVGRFDLLLDCSAEPSVHAGSSGSPATVIHTNLVGTIHCFEAARQHGAAILFLSSSRIYPIAALNGLRYVEDATRFRLAEHQDLVGSSDRGIAEDFPLDGPRSFYGATKLASELLLQEYVFNYDVPGLIYRCGVLAGPWQMGRVDQGFLSLWVARHHFRKPLKYIGFGGTGKQVRDVLHVDDLCDLVLLHLAEPSAWDGRIYSVGGGSEVSTSLLELTDLCQQEIGHRVTIEPVPDTSPLDVRLFISDCTKISHDIAWKPQRRIEEIVTSTARWVADHESALEKILG